MFRSSTFSRCANTAARVATPTRTESGFEHYTFANQALHWLNGGAMIFCVATACYCKFQLPAWKDCTEEESRKKSNMMWLHKSMGTTAAILMVPRVYYRLRRPMPKAFGHNDLERMAGRLGHGLLYGAIIFMPVSGVAMGYLGGNGVPFWFTTITPMSGQFGKAYDGAKAGRAYNMHKTVGVALEYAIPLHVGAAFFHQFAQGANIFARIVPGAARTL